ncbi:hypothetical protein C1A50_1260 [Paenibacillus polymyxa]|nr:hypothetical protein C1A50_1260 [Paenibacillus polymyxa]
MTRILKDFLIFFSIIRKVLAIQNDLQIKKNLSGPIFS